MIVRWNVIVLCAAHVRSSRRYLVYAFLGPLGRRSRASASPAEAMRAVRVEGRDTLGQPRQAGGRELRCIEARVSMLAPEPYGAVVGRPRKDRPTTPYAHP